MADCSGSTPLKALADQGVRDRSLQQDRSRQLPARFSTFRSGGPAASTEANQAYHHFSRENDARSLAVAPTYGGVLSDPGREVASGGVRHFMTGPRAKSEHSPITNHPLSHGLPEASASNAWAADFEAFSRGMANAEPVTTRAGALGSSRQHYAQTLGIQPPAAPMLWHQVAIPSNRAEFHADSQTLPQNAEIEFDTAMRQWMEANGDKTGQEDVDAVLEELAQELEAGQRADLPLLQPTHGPSVEGLTNRLASASGPVSQRSLHVEQVGAREQLTPDDSSLLGTGPNISNLSLDDAAQSAVTNQTQPAPLRSEVSEAARQLLDTVQHEKAEKWQNSQFLMLMRDFRDGSKDIVDNEIRQASGPSDDSRKERSEASLAD